MKTFKITYTMNGKIKQMTKEIEGEMNKPLAHICIFWNKIPYISYGKPTKRESWEDELTDTGKVDTGKPEKGGFGVVKNVDFKRIA